MPTPTLTDELLEIYAESTIRLDSEHQIGLTGPDAVKTWPFRGDLIVLTAANPGSVRLGDEENAARNDQLLAALQATGLSLLPVITGEDDWQEHGYGVFGLDDAQARKLAAHFEQLAWYVVNEYEVRVVSTQTGAAVHRRTRRHGLPTIPPTPPVEDGALPT